MKQNGTGCPRTGRLAGLMQHISISQDVATLEWRSARAPPSYFFFFFQICSDLGVTVGPAFKVRRSGSEHTKSAGYSVISAAAQSRRPSPAFVPARRPKTTGPYYRLQSGPVNILPLGHAHQRRNAPERMCCSVRRSRSRSHTGEEVRGLACPSASPSHARASFYRPLVIEEARCLVARGHEFHMECFVIHRIHLLCPWDKERLGNVGDTEGKTWRGEQTDLQSVSIK